MKLQDTTTTVEHIGTVSNESQFKMKSSRKAFQILSDLYSDKPLAIVRELGCNASDSMVAAGKADQPFHIHLPNTLEPWITIQDFGTGISHEDIYNIYSVYFESTKTNTNSQIGCLGLGSKSPFCYTDNFTVTSVVDGVKRIYNAYFNEQSTPAIALASMNQTDECNGVAVQIPVKASDFHNFTQSVYKSFRFFDVKPTISGGKIDWKTETPQFKGDSWMFFDSLAGYNGTCYAIMGGVTYPVDNYKLNSDNYTIARSGLVMKFEMGELDFTPSRESLSYCPATIAALNNKIASVTKELPDKINQIIDEKETLLDALKAVMFFNEKFHHIFNSKSNLTWKGNDISNPLTFFKGLAPNLKVYKKQSWHRKKITVSIQPDYNADWYVDDLARGSERRVKHHVSSTQRSIMLFDSQDYNKLISKGFDKSLFKSVSSLPSPTVQRKITKSGTVTVKAKEDITVYTIGSYSNTSWEREVIEPQDEVPKYYIVKSTDGWNMNLKLNYFQRHITTKGTLANVCKAFDININDVCMVSTREEKKLIDRKSVSLVEHFKNLKLDIDMDEMSRVMNSNSVGNTYFLDTQIQNEKKKAWKKLPDDNKIKQAINKLVELKRKYNKYSDVCGFMVGYSEKVKYDTGLSPAQNIVMKDICGHVYDFDKYMILAEALG